MAPGYSALGCSACTMVVIFAVAGCLLVALLAPVVPSFRTDVTTHFAIHEEGSGIRTPWSAQVNFVNTWLCGELALIEHITIFLTGRTGCSCDVAVSLAMNLTILKPCSSWTKDEIGGSLNITVVKGRAVVGNACIDSILIAQQSTVLYQDMIAFQM